jgi:16S rRNA (guanine527-N7)-methyltransferase
MFHGKQFDERLRRVTERVGIVMTPEQRSLLGRFGAWLASEGVDSGGIGPDEAGRLTDRHIADALVFAAAWTRTPVNVLDVGSGMGLPGIPLAIAHPTTHVTLLDRSRERCRLMRRAIRILELPNVTVAEGEVEAFDGVWDSVVFRASLPPSRALPVAARLLSPEGCAVVALSRSAPPETLPSPPAGTVVELVEVADGVLDSPAWLLRMTLTYPSPTNGLPS